MMPFNPLGDRVLVKRSTIQETKRGQIIIPDIALARPQEGQIVEIGPKVSLVAVGDRVLFGRFAGIEVHIHDEVFLIFRETDLLGVIT